MHRPWRWIGLAATLALVAGAVAATDDARSASVAKVRVFDRTLQCNVPLRAGLRLVEVFGQSGVRDQDDSSKWFALSNVSLSVNNASLAALQAGAPRSDDGAPQAQGTFWINTRACPAPASRNALAPTGLGGGRLSQLPERYKCTLPKRIVLRIRAEFGSPVTLRTPAGGLTTQAPLAKGHIMIRSERGAPLLYADVLESGRARLFFRGDCLRA